MAKPKFNQIIRPGDNGRDVKAVKIAYRRIGVPGSGAMALTTRAGPAFAQTTRNFQHGHGLRVDGIYGQSTHNKLITLARDGKPAFSAYDAAMYSSARKRHPAYPPVPPGNAETNAKKLIQYHNEGKYHDDSGRDLAQIEATAVGKPVWSQMGRYVHLDARVMEVLVWMIESGLQVGTFAICSDHPYDSPLGHAGGRAVDISSINRISVAAHSATAREVTLKAAVLLSKHTPTHLRPWQQICDGYGYVHDGAISACTIPGASFYGSATMSAHRNHIHVGY